MSLFWRLLDPLLLRLRSRLEHLDVHMPSDYRERFTRTRGRFDPAAIVAPAARVLSVGAPARISVGAYSHIAGEIMMLTPEAECTFGRYCFLGTDSRLWVQTKMTIGDYVLIAPRVDIFDNDSHPLKALRRREDAIDQFERKRPMNYDDVPSAPIIIEDDVWIGTKSTILKGVRIGRGAVVAAASVVTKDVPPFTLVAGNPAREIKKLDE